MRLSSSSVFCAINLALSCAVGCGPLHQNVGSGDPSVAGGSFDISGRTAQAGGELAGDTIGASAAAGGAGSVRQGNDQAGAGSSSTSTTPVAPNGPAKHIAWTEAIPDSLQQSLATATGTDRTALLTTYAAPATALPGYDAVTAKGMDLIQSSSLALNANELAVLSKQGLVISQRQTFPSFPYGYKAIYGEDLPLYVSADSILEALHRTFDVLLRRTEDDVLIGELSALLDGMRNRLATASMDASVTADADLYLTLAASLLKGQQMAPGFESNLGTLSSLYSLVNAETGHRVVSLFGVDRDEDFSQFAPRGHYSNSLTLSKYFKAMMWLGRVDLRIVETQSDGTQLFHRRQFDAAVALRELLGATEFALWQHIDDTIGAFMGEHDSLTPRDLDGLLAALDVQSLADAATLTDQSIVDEIQRGGWGAQRIASRIMWKDDATSTTLPLDRSFLLFGQRYTVDSNVFVNVTYDRVAERLMPKPADVAFAALGNNSALSLLSGEFGNASYVVGLAKTRALVDAHEDAYWEGSIYTRWLGALRSLSPKNAADLPSIGNTPVWRKRILSTQLGSWAELRHDTVLYAKQPYTISTICEFPDAYVDPYPEFYARLATMADPIATLAWGLPASTDGFQSSVAAWVQNFKAAVLNLQKMAEDQRTGTPHSAELMAFINDAVKWDESTMCGGPSRSNLSGWYLKLFLDGKGGFEYAPLIADVHTQPTDQGGNDVGRVLHVGTGAPRLMIVTTETCQGPRAYAGLAFSYGEVITENWKRINDLDWTKQLESGPFPDVPWMSEALAQ